MAKKQIEITTDHELADNLLAVLLQDVAALEDTADVMKRRLAALAKERGVAVPVA